MSDRRIPVGIKGFSDGLGGGTRQNNLDLARTYAMFMVILNHVVDYYLLRTEPNRLVYYLEAMSHSAVPVFLMLTGALLLKRPIDLEPGEFYKKSFFKLALPSMLFTSINALVDTLRGRMTWELFLEGIRAGMLRLYPSWYMFMLVGVYAVIPIICLVKRNINSRKYAIIGIVFFLWAMISQQKDTFGASYSIGCSLSYLGFVILGNIISERTEKHKSNTIGLILVITGLGLQLVNFTTLFNIVKNGGAYYTKSINAYSAPLKCISSIMIFSGFSMLDIKKNWKRLSESSFIVYLSHKMVLDLWNDLLYGRTDKITKTVWELVGIIAVSVIVTFVGSYLISSAYQHASKRTRLCFKQKNGGIYE